MIIANVSTATDHLAMVIVTKALDKKNRKCLAKAELLQEGIFFLIHLFARDVLVIKKLEIEKTKPTFIIFISFKSWIGGLSFFDFKLF